MGISFVCGGCSQRLGAAEKIAGKKVKCPKCGGVVTVPQSATSPSKKPARTANSQTQKSGEYPTSGIESSDATRSNASSSLSSELARSLRALEQPIKPIRRSFFYRFWLLALAAIMIALPLLYLALVVGVGYGVYLHAISNTHILGEGPNLRAKIFVVMLYVVPILTGIVVVLFLIKPFFAPRKETFVPLSLTPKEQPFLFKYLDAMCRAVGAPTIRAVNVDVQINASASLRRGIWSLFSKDLVLTIGLPLAANFSIRELTGVIAHEMGHFTQGAGMGVTYIVRSINAWFARIVYERDAWDERLAQCSSSGIHYSIFLTALAIRFGVWLSRKFLWVLMHIGHAASCSMLRQMEFDADLCETRLVGSRTFVATSRRFPPLQVAGQSAGAHLFQMGEENTLPDDLPWMIRHELKRLPATALRDIEEAIEKSVTGFFDTHPSERERRERALKEDAQGLPLSDQPAVGLFRDFDNLCRIATRHYYLSMFGADAMDGVQVLPSQKLLKVNEKDWAAEESAQRFFQVELPNRIPVPLNLQSLGQTGEGAAAQQRLKEARERHALAIAHNIGNSMIYDAVYDDWMNTRIGLALVNADVILDTKAFGLPNNPKKIAHILEDKRQKLLATDGSLTNMAKAAARRLEAAILWLNSSAGKKVSQSKPLYERAAHLAVAVRNLGKLMPSVIELAQIATEAKVLEMTREENPNAGHAQRARLSEEIRIRMSEILTKMNAIQATFKRIPTPFAPPKDSANASQYEPEAISLVSGEKTSVDAANLLCQTVSKTYVRALEHLVHIAEKAEQSAGFDPINIREVDMRNSAPSTTENHSDETFAVELPADTAVQTPQIYASKKPHPSSKRLLRVGLAAGVILALVVGACFAVPYIAKHVGKQESDTFSAPPSTGLMVLASPGFYNLGKEPFNPEFDVSVTNVTGRKLTKVKIIGTVTIGSYSDTKVFDALAEAKCDSLAEKESINFYASFKKFTPPRNQHGGSLQSRPQYTFTVDDSATH